MISRQQHGFTKGRSCVTQLLDVMDAWTEILDEGGSIDIIYMDFMKAFDSVPGPNYCSLSSSVGDGAEAVADPHDARLAT